MHADVAATLPVARATSALVDEAPAACGVRIAVCTWRARGGDGLEHVEFWRPAHARFRTGAAPALQRRVTVARGGCECEYEF